MREFHCILRAHIHAILIEHNFIYLNISRNLDLLQGEVVAVVEEQQHERLEEGDLQLLVALREGGAQHAVAQRGLPLQLAPAVLGQVELAEHGLVPQQVGRQPHLNHRVRGPVPHRQDGHRQL